MEQRTTRFRWIMQDRDWSLLLAMLALASLGWIVWGVESLAGVLKWAVGR